MLQASDAVDGRLADFVDAAVPITDEVTATLRPALSSQLLTSGFAATVSSLSTRSAQLTDRGSSVRRAGLGSRPEAP